MLPLTTKETHAFTPDYYKADVKAPTYLIRPASLYDRPKLRARLRQLGVNAASDVEYYQALREGYATLAGGGADAQMLDLIDHKQAGTVLEPQELELFSQLETAVSAGHPPFGDILARNKYARDVMPLVGFQMFVTGWEGVETKFEQINGEVTEAAMARIPELDLIFVGAKAIALMNPTDTDQKN